MRAARRRNAWLAAAAATVLLPLPLLAPALTGERVFVPFDHRVFAPANLPWSDAELAAFHRASNFDPTETTLVCREEALFAQQELTRGRFPAWNPYARAGAPLFASTLNGFAHPPFVLHLLADPQHAFVWTAWLQCALAGLTMLGLLRELRAPPLPALLGAVVFAAGGPMLARLHLFMHYGGWMWLPALLWALHRLARGGGAGAAAALALGTALTWTAGFPPAALVTSLVAGAAWVLLVLCAGRRRARVAAFGAGGFALGLGLAAVQILPMLAFFPESQRDLQRDATVLREQGLDRAHWLGFVLESPFSTPQQNRAGGVPHDKAPLLWLLTDRAGETGAQPRLKSTEHRTYLGALPLLLVVLGAACWRRRGARFALAAAVALLLLAHGDALLLALATVVPQVRALQPMEFLGPLPCLAGMLAAFGLQRALRRSARPARIAAAAAGAMLAALCALGAALLATAEAGTVEGWFLAGMRARWGDAYQQAGGDAVRAAFAPVLPAATALLRANFVHGALCFAAAALVVGGVRRAPRAAAALGVAFAAAELLVVAAPFVRHQPPIAPADSPVHAFLRERRDALAGEGGFMVARVSAADAASGVARSEPAWALPPDTLVPERIRDLNAYTELDGRTHVPLRELYRGTSPPVMVAESFFQAFPDDPRLEHPLFDLYGVRYMLCFSPPGRAPLRHAGGEALPPLRGPAGSFHVHERPRACPRAFVVPAAELVADDEAALGRMLDPAFDPRSGVVLTADVAQQVPPGWPRAAAGASAAAAGSARFMLDEASHLQIAVRSPTPAFLVLTDPPLRGWSATVDQAPTPILRGNHCFRAIAVPAGDSVVALRYDPPGLLAGASVSALAALVWLALAVTGVRTLRARAIATRE